MQNDYQSLGAQLVTNLLNKIMMALFDPAKPFFKMQLTDEQLADLVANSALSESQVEAAMARVERQAMQKLPKMKARTALTTIIKHLIITGNCLMWLPEGEKCMRAYSIRDYLIRRDLEGNMIKLIIQESKTVDALPDDLISLAREHGYEYEDEVCLYTGIVRVGNRYIVWQELEAIAYAQKRVGWYSADKLPWIPLTWDLVQGKDMGTGHVESNAGDFHSYSTLAEASLDYTTIVTDVKTLVNPAGMTDVRKLNKAKSGDAVSGREEDIHVHTADVSGNIQFLESQQVRVERRLGAAFLMNSAVTRDAERVTAEEIRRQAFELESSLGGVYSRLAEELQIPLAKFLLRNMHSLFEDVEPVIVTGLESLSRNSDLDNFKNFLGDLAAVSELDDSVKVRLEMNNVIAKLGAGHGVDYEDTLKDEEQVKKELADQRQVQAQQAGMEAGAVAQAQGK